MKTKNLSACAGIAGFAAISPWDQFVSFFPIVIGAFVVFTIGLMIAFGFGKLTTKILEIIKVDEAVKGLGIEGKVAGVRKFSLAVLGGELVKWILVIVALLAVADVLGLNQLAEFIRQVLLYIPNVIVAIVILLLALLLSDFIAKTVQTTLEAAKIRSAGLVASVAKWAVVIFAGLIVLNQLGIAPKMMEILLVGFVVMIALAGGLAFGLGGKDLAAEILNKIKEDISKR